MVYSINAPTTQWTVDGLDCGTTYVFAATAVNSTGSESSYSNEVRYTPTVPKTRVTLAWDSVPEAATYKLYVGTQSILAGNLPALTYSTTETRFRVQALEYLTTYYFVVTAINSNGIESGFSNKVVYSRAQ
jgi:hypothetical protein